MSGRHWDGTVTHWSRKHSKHQQNLDEVFFPSVRVAPIVECVEFDYFAVLWQFGDVSILLCSYEHWISVMVENLHVNCHRKIAKTKVDDINVAICRRKLVFLQLLGKLLRSFITSHRLSTEITFSRQYRMNYKFLSILIDMWTKGKIHLLRFSIFEWSRLLQENSHFVVTITVSTPLTSSCFIFTFDIFRSVTV